MATRDGTAPDDARLATAFAEAEHAGQELAMRVRVPAALVIAAWTLFDNTFPGGFWYCGAALLFGALGILPVRLRRAGIDRPWLPYLFISLDIVLFCVVVLIDNPIQPSGHPPQARLRYGNEPYLFLFVVYAAFSYSPRLVAWTGLVAAAAWAFGVALIARRPDSLGTDGLRHPGMSWSDPTPLASWFDPHWVEVGRHGRIVVLLLVEAATLAAIVARARRLVQRQVGAERARANLSRYLSPSLVDELAANDTPLRTAREQPVTVLFVDLVGFTALTEGAAPDAVIALLRVFHRHMVEAVFAHGGTVDKYLGDGLMATFGTPSPAADDAARALACVGAMVAAMGRWNGERTAHGAPPLAIGIGVHHGPAVLGDVGDERRLEFAVLGATVNLASRLQELTRHFGCTALASRETLAAAERLQRPAPGWRPLGAQTVRGFSQPIEMWAIA